MSESNTEKGTVTYTKEEQAANRAKWVEALRSGDYQQGKGWLRVVNEDETVSFCCLGVACEISGLSDWDENGRYLERTTMLPYEVQDWLGLSEAVGWSTADLRGLPDLNDNEGYTFSQIADLIEQGKVETV